MIKAIPTMKIFDFVNELEDFHFYLYTNNYTGSSGYFPTLSQFIRVRLHEAHPFRSITDAVFGPYGKD